MESPPDKFLNDEQLMTSQERAALALWLVQQMPLATNVLAMRLGMTRQGTWMLMTTISRVVPVHYCEGVWKIAVRSTGG